MVKKPLPQVLGAFSTLLAMVVGGCVLEPVPTTGLECPCAAGWQCDRSANVCVRGAAGVCGRPEAEPGAITITNLHVEWVTASQARIAWEADNLDELFAYEVDIAASEEQLLAGELFRTVTSDDNPELARSFLVGAAGADPVVATTLFELTPAEQYHVRLVAEDSSSRVTCSDVIGVLLNPPADLGFPMADESAGFRSSESHVHRFRNGERLGPGRGPLLGMDGPLRAGCLPVGRGVRQTRL